jgi:hypothetical protein
MSHALVRFNMESTARASVWAKMVNALPWPCWFSKRARYFCPVGARGAIVLPGGLFGPFDQTAIGDNILHPREALAVMHLIQEPEAQNVPHAGPRTEQIESMGIMLFGRVENGQLQLVQQAVSSVDPGEVHLDPLVRRRIGKPRGDPMAIGLIGDLLPDLRSIVLTIRSLDLREEFRSFAQEGHAASEQIPSGAPRRGIARGLREHAATQEHGDVLGSNVVVVGFAPRDGFHGEGLPEDEGKALPRAPVRKPRPREDPFERDDNVVTIGCDDLQEGLRACLKILVPPDLPSLVQEADVHRPGVEIDPTVRLMWFGIESQRVASSEQVALSKVSIPRWYAEEETSISINRVQATPYGVGWATASGRG